MPTSPAVSADIGPDQGPGAILEALPHPVLCFDRDGEATYANASTLAAFGHRVVGSRFADLFPDQPGMPHATLAPFALASKAQGRFQAVVGAMPGGGVLLSLLPEAGAAPAAPAEVDELTGLLKRGEMNRRLDEALAAGAAGTAGTAGAAGVAVLCLDLDQFKVVNDTLGHEVGDNLLRKVADRIRSACRRGDFVARVGGDEFVVIQTDLAAPDDAERLAARLVDLVGRTYVLGGHTVNIGTSIGVAPGEAGLVARDLLRRGDLALYEAKRAGRNRFRRFEPGMDAALRERRELEIDMRRALALKQFQLHYQPFLDVASQAVIGFEALIRWEHPTRRSVSPAEFIPLAEETGLILRIGEWVLRTACATAATWPGELAIAVNISPVQFRSDRLVETVVSALANAGLPPHRLEIEITEGALLDNTDSVLATLHALRDLGVRISMDDFGTGYSSLSYLQKFPFNKIKIDRSFVQGADEGGDSEAILKAIAGLGVSLGMAITAEGVETPEQLRRIQAEQCTHVQGYLTGRPMPAERVPSFLSE